MRAKNIYLLLTLLILVFGGLVGGLKTRELLAKKAAIGDNGRTLIELQEVLSKEEKSLNETGEVFQTNFKDFKEKTAGILPKEEEYTKLTRILDDFFDKNLKEADVIIANSLQYSPGAKLDIKSVSVLPLSINLVSSRENLFKFLQFVDNSGSLENGVRLLDIRSITMSLPASSKEDITADLELKAFYRNQQHGSTTEIPTT